LSPPKVLVRDVVFDPVNASAPSVERRQELAAIHHALTSGEVAGGASASWNMS